jgi:4-hydroxy-tetrahydrodipicolinate synthase
MRTVELTKGEFNVLCCDCAFYALIPVVMASGGKGTSNVTGSMCPREFAELSKPWENYEDVLKTREHLYRLLPLIRMMYSESNPVPLKAALNMVGADVGKPRKPLQELGEANMKAMRQTMQRLGILDEDSYQRRFFSKK